MEIVVSTNDTSTKSENVTSTMLKNSDDKKVRYKMDCYILQKNFTSDHINIKNCNYLLSIWKTKRSKQKGIEATTIQKWRIVPANICWS